MITDSLIAGKYWQIIDIEYIPRIELVYNTLETYNSKKPRGETRDPGKQKNGEGNERTEASGIRQCGRFHLLGRRSLVGEHDLRVRCAGRRRRRRRR